MLNRIVGSSNKIGGELGLVEGWVEENSSKVHQTGIRGTRLVEGWVENLLTWGVLEG